MPTDSPLCCPEGARAEATLMAPLTSLAIERLTSRCTCTTCTQQSCTCWDSITRSSPIVTAAAISASPTSTVTWSTRSWPSALSTFGFGVVEVVKLSAAQGSLTRSTRHNKGVRTLFAPSSLVSQRFLNDVFVKDDCGPNQLSRVAAYEDARPSQGDDGSNSLFPRDRLEDRRVGFLHQARSLPRHSFSAMGASRSCFRHCLRGPSTSICHFESPTIFVRQSPVVTNRVGAARIAGS